jgi:hypothetical protein
MQMELEERNGGRKSLKKRQTKKGVATEPIF